MTTMDDKGRATVKLADFLWTTGRQIVALEFSLGSAEKASGCRITLADSYYKTAADLINHSLTSGGLESLEPLNAAVMPTIPLVQTKAALDGNYIAPSVGTVAPGTSGNGVVATGSGFTPEVKAFLDCMAKRETSDPLGVKGYYAKNGAGFFTEADTLAGGGFPLSQGRNQNIGRYQFNRGDWEEAKRKIPAIKGFSPLDQDLVAYSKIMNNNRGGKQLLAGDIVAALTQGGNQQRLAFYKDGKGSQASPVRTVKPALPSTTSTVLPVIKGSRITIEIDNNIFQYSHQSTETSDNGLTIIGGVGVAWKTSRKKRSATYKDLSLKQVAQEFSKTHNLRLDYQAKTDPVYKHLDQSGISDYQLLLRECTEYGLMMSDAKGVLVIKDIKGISFTGEGKPVETYSDYVLEIGKNIISFNITDRARGSQDDDISKFLPSEAKSFIDPISGKVIELQKDVVADVSNRLTGRSKNPSVGLLKDGQDFKKVAKGALKRIAGLPSSFVLPLTSTTLHFNPLEAVTTLGLPGCLSRIWVIKSVKHDIDANQTTLDLMSPVETLEAIPPQESPAALAALGIKPATTTASVGEGSLNSRILSAALQSKGIPTGDSNVPTRVACAWVVNRIVLKRAGISKIGSVQDRVDSVRAAMESGRGVQVPRGQELPGDILIMGSGERAHIGIFIGGNLTLSNSSSKGTFTWTDTYEAYVAYYGSGTYYRVKN